MTTNDHERDARVNAWLDKIALELERAIGILAASWFLIKGLEWLLK